MRISGKEGKLFGRVFFSIFTLVIWSTGSPFLSAQQESKLYWTDSDNDGSAIAKVSRANLNGTNIEHLVTPPALNPRFIALNPIAGKMYWTDIGTISRANLDGTNVEPYFIDGFPGPEGVAIDLSAAKIYWTDTVLDQIWRADLSDGTNGELLIDHLNDPWCLALDPSGGKMYWTNISHDDPSLVSIQRANLDGSNQETLVIQGFSWPHGLALNTAAGKMYWTCDDGIRRANLDGTNIEVLPISGYGFRGIALDITRNRMYWTTFSPGTIWRAYLDGSSPEELVSANLDTPWGLALLMIPGGYEVLPEVIWAPATGGGTWVSEVQVTDLTGGSVVSAIFNYGGGNRRGPFKLWTSPRQNDSVSFGNILLALGTLDPAFSYYGRIGSLELLTQDSSHEIRAAARTFNGNYSKTFPGLFPVDANTASPTRKMMIQNYVNNATYRSTCGFFNLTPDAVTVRFQLIDPAGNSIGSTFYKTLVGYDFRAFSPFTEAGVPYPSYSYDQAFLLVNPVSGAGKVMCFGASANNLSNDPAAHIAAQYQGSHDNAPSSYQVLPEAIWAPATGGGTWVSEVQITDLSGGSVVSAYFNYGGGERRGPITVWTNGGGANRSGKFANILSAMQSLDSGFAYYGRVGAVEFLTQDSFHSIQVAARTLNGDYSKTLPGFGLTDSNTADATRKMMIQNYANNASYRSTCGFFNPTADPLTVEFRLLDGDGNLLGSAFTKDFMGYDFKAFSPFNEAGIPYPAYFLSNVLLLVNPTSGTGKIMCFGASANNTTNDPAAHIAVQY